MSCYSWAPGELEGVPLRSLSPVWVWLLWTMSAGAFDPFTWVLITFSSRRKHLNISNSDLLSNCSDATTIWYKVRDPIFWTAVWCDDEYEKSLFRTYATCYMTCVTGSAVLSSALSARCPTNRWSETRETTSYLNGIFMPSRRQDMYAALSCLVSFSNNKNVKSNTNTSLFSIPWCRQDMSANFNIHCQLENGRKMRNYSKSIIAFFNWKSWTEMRPFTCSS